MKKLLVIAMIGALAGSVFAEEGELVVEKDWSPAQLNLATPLGVCDGVRDIKGLRFNIFYGRSVDVIGADIGISGVAVGNVRGLQLSGYNQVEGYFKGVQFGAVANYVTRNVYGVQVAGIINWTHSDAYGVQLGLVNISLAYDGVQVGALNWQVEPSYGLDLGCVNASQSDYMGCEIGVLNYCKGNFIGCQIGVFNMVKGHSEGLQLGLFNAAEHHTGVQLGLLNLNVSGSLPVMAFVNANF